MKNFILLSVLIVASLAGCTEKKPAVYTVLGDYTPYESYMEKLNGRIASVVETNFWAVADGETFIKGAKMTQAQLDSLGYTGDFEAKFDTTGNLVSCAGMDEKMKTIWKWELTKVNDISVKTTYTVLDTLRGRQKLDCNPAGDIIKISQYPGDTDTLYNWASVNYTPDRDTVLYQWYNYKSEPTTRTLKLYNESGLHTGYQSYDKEGNYLGGSELKYGDLQVSSEITFFNKNKEPASKNIFTYEFDKAGNWVRVICKDDKGFTIIGERVYTYFD